MLSHIYFPSGLSSCLVLSNDIRNPTCWKNKPSHLPLDLNFLFRLSQARNYLMGAESTSSCPSHHHKHTQAHTSTHEHKHNLTPRPCSVLPVVTEALRYSKHPHLTSNMPSAKSSPYDHHSYGETK